MTDSNSDPGSGTRTIKSVETSITILESLMEFESPKVSELADATDNSRANVYKHLQTLQKHGFVMREENKYRLSLRYLDFGGFVRDQIDGTRIIKPRMVEAAEKTGEIVQYMVREGGHTVIIYRESGHQGVLTRARIGYRYPIHQVASGKTMLASMPKSEVEEIIDQYGLFAATENTITSKESLYEELEEIRSKGYAINNQESTKGLYSIAVPVSTPDQDVIGACAVSGPVHRLRKQKKTKEVIETMRSLVNEIELNLTHS
ncbi:IclR family transcriptional regulator [Natrinema sp. SYSU A 869]|uniref:IclR family transcriptional regulator n=1 Tax=Natrinema sp. SYSU A 869 TaxID=2871694 RepID=UPI001CA3935E|nr:IclR family transcriptional regulator [Natrinema sp. SYSU A 869]